MGVGDGVGRARGWGPDGGMGMRGAGRAGPVPQIRSNWEAPASMHMAKSAMAKASK